MRALTTRTVWRRRPDRPAVVLGSGQGRDAVDLGRADAAGLTVVRRRSGGGAVLVLPGDPLWFDVWVPAGDPLFGRDVIGAATWVGEWWAAALVGLGVADLDVHRGALVATRWSPLVCFAGLGAGEVRAGGRKVVGVAQWRAREGSLFHAAAHRRWRPAQLVDVLALDERARTAAVVELEPVAVGLDDLAPRGLAESLGPALIETLPGDGWRVDPG